MKVIKVNANNELCEVKVDNIREVKKLGQRVELMEMSVKGAKEIV